jgi:pimeloyl-ACP methyl ester carboxylesterase
VSLARVVQLVVAAVHGAGLQGCVAFGHSAGGAVALLAASACPGLFSAIYCFEPVVASPASHAMLAAAAAGAVSTSGQQLANMARRRRAAFGSRQAAQQHLAAKPPFASMHPACLALYVQHGLVDAQQQQAAADAAAPTGTGAAAAQQGTHHKQQQQQPAGVVLACRPSVEAAYYAALDPPPAIMPKAVTCPVALVVAALPSQQGDDRSGVSAAARFASHAAVKSWALQQQQPGKKQGSALHSILAVLSMELAALMPTARLQELGGVTHFGPLEQPEAVAASCVQFFDTCLLPRGQQQGRL